MSLLSRRTLLATSAAAGVGLSALAGATEAIAGGGSAAIRTFGGTTPQAALDDLRRRVTSALLM